MQILDELVTKNNILKNNIFETFFVNNFLITSDN